MTHREAELLYSYLYNRQSFLESELVSFQQKIRLRKVDTVDCLELIILIERSLAFREFSCDVKNLLKVR